MANLYVTFKVLISEDQFSFQCKHTELELQLMAPEQLLTLIDPGEMLLGIMHAALDDYARLPEKDEEEEV